MIIKQSCILTVNHSPSLFVFSVFGLLAIFSLSISCARRSFQQNSNLGNSSQTVPEAAPLPPIVLPSTTRGLRREVCERQAIKKRQPVYPDEAERENITGSVVVDIIIDEKGVVESAHALSGSTSLREAAVEAAMEWRFRPYTVGGKPEKIICSITFSFPAKGEGKKTEREGFEK